MNLPGKAIVYTNVTRPRFSELDINGHLNSICLLQMVMDSRYAFFVEKMGGQVRTLAEQGIGIYTTKIGVNYRHSVNEGEELRIDSFVTFRAHPVMGLGFKVTSLTTGKIIADGKFEQVFVDPLTGRVLEQWPDHTNQYYFEDGATCDDGDARKP